MRRSVFLYYYVHASDYWLPAIAKVVFVVVNFLDFINSVADHTVVIHPGNQENNT